MYINAFASAISPFYHEIFRYRSNTLTTKALMFINADVFATFFFVYSAWHSQTQHPRRDEIPHKSYRDIIYAIWLYFIWVGVNKRMITLAYYTRNCKKKLFSHVIKLSAVYFKVISIIMINWCDKVAWWCDFWKISFNFFQRWILDMALSHGHLIYNTHNRNRTAHTSYSVLGVSCECKEWLCFTYNCHWNILSSDLFEPNVHINYVEIYNVFVYQTLCSCVCGSPMRSWQIGHVIKATTSYYNCNGANVVIFCIMLCNTLRVSINTLRVNIKLFHECCCYI